MNRPPDHSRQLSGAAEQETGTNLEALVRDDYDRLRTDDSFDDLKHRARFSKEDRCLYQDWMRVAAQRATTRQMP